MERALSSRTFMSHENKTYTTIGKALLNYLGHVAVVMTKSDYSGTCMFTEYSSSGRDHFFPPLLNY